MGAIVKMSDEVYTANRHVVRGICCDSEPVLVEMRDSFGKANIYPHYSPPHFHAVLVERYIQVLDTRCNAMLCHLPFVTPANLLLHAAKYTAVCINLLPCKRTLALVGKNRGKSPSVSFY